MNVLKCIFEKDKYNDFFFFFQNYNIQFAIKGHIHNVKTYSDNCVPSHRDNFHACDHLQALLLYPSHHASGAAEGPDGTRLRGMRVCLILVD